MAKMDLSPADRGRQIATRKAAGLMQFGTDTQIQAGTRDDRAVSVKGMYDNLDEVLSAKGQILYADVTLTSAQVKALAATQIELVAAPGAGKALMFHGALLKLDYGGTNAFTESSITFGIKYTDDSGVQVCTSIEATGFIDQTADTYTNAVAPADVIVAATGIENQALVLDNLGGGEVAGNAANDNTLVVRTYYSVVSI